MSKDIMDGYNNQARPLTEQNAGYRTGQMMAEQHAEARNAPPRPLTEGEHLLGRYFRWAIGASLLAAGIGACAGLFNDRHPGEWAVGGFGLTFAAFMTLLALFVGVAIVIELLRFTVKLAIGAAVLAVPAGLVLMALCAFGIGPGLTFL